MKIKLAPEQWQQESVRQFDVIITFEKRVFDTVYEGLFCILSDQLSTQ
jgi:protein-tyrosine-phosphatase